MKDAKKTKKLTQVIIPLKWGINRKKFYINIPDDEVGRESLRAALRQIEKMGDSCKEWTEFLDRATKIFIANKCELGYH